MSDPLFASHKLNDQGFAKAKRIGAAFETLLADVSEVCGSGREFSITKTKLEEACFFAKKAMATLPENQQP